MTTEQFAIYTNNQKAISLQAKRLVFYQGIQIIEAHHHQDVYYVLFYKHRYLAAVKAKTLRLKSFVASAFRQGFVFSAPNPFIDVLLSEGPLPMLSFEALLDKLDKHYTPQVKAFILTCFESFISKKRLFQEITSLFYVYRRKGQMFLGYRIIRILMDFAPNHSLVKQLAGDRRFRQHAALYNNHSAKLWTDDPIFAEKVFYAERDHYFPKLITLLDGQSRWMEMIVLYGEKLLTSPADDYYKPLLRLLDEHLTNEQRAFILEQLYYRLPHYKPLRQDLLMTYMTLNRITGILSMYRDPDLNLDKLQADAIGKMLEQLDLSTLSLTPAQLQTLFTLTTQLNPNDAEKLLHDDIKALLKTYDSADIKNLLAPFSEHQTVHPLYRKIDTIVTYQDDLDQMQLVGELYYEFSQFEQALDAFSWEAELKPDDPEPPQWLSYVYQALGMTQEAEAYGQLSASLQKSGS